ncbi:MAG: murein biosynthesis integral membrane protein MurJ [Pelomonas sp.]|nr:murein biosynthesis integral membrane protein MurJ [Roseateles sp.]
MSLFRAASVISALTLVSRVVGLVREQLQAALFGANSVTDAFLVAFRIPNLLRRLFGEGAFSQAFVPVLAATRAKEGDAATRALIDAATTVLTWALAATCVIGVVGAPVLVWMLGAGLPREAFGASVVMTRWMFPYIGCMSLVALAAGVLNTWRHFAVPALTPVLLNLSMIACGWWLAPRFEQWGWPPIYAWAVGVMVGGVLQLLVQLPAMARIGVLPRLRSLRESWRHPGVQQVLRQMAPALLGVGVAQISLLINTQVALWISAGAASWLTYADRLMEFPTALLGVALGVVMTPQLAAAQARGDAAGYSAMLDMGLRLTLLFALPSAVALGVFALPMVAVLYQRGAFHPVDAVNTSHAVMGYGAGLLGLTGIKVLAPGFYARQDTRTPVKVAVMVLVLTQLFNLIFVPLIGAPGLSLSIGLGATANAGLLLFGLRARGSYRARPGWWPFALRVVGASAAMGAFQWWAAGRFEWIAERHHELHRALALAGCLAASAAIYFAVLIASGLKLRELLRRS